MRKTTLYLKVLNEKMESCNGGKQTWKLGEKITAKGKLKMCRNGIHLTLSPFDWAGTRVFIAKAYKIAEIQEYGAKIVCLSATLIRELLPKDLKAYEDGKAPLWKAYEDGCQKAPLWKAYEDGKAPLLKAYEDGCQKLIWKILKGER